MPFMPKNFVSGDKGRIRSAVGAACILFCLLLAGASPAFAFMQTYSVSIDVDAGTADREDKPVDLNVDLTEFLTVIPGTLDPATLQVVEVDGVGASLNESVLFQFDPDPAFDPTTNAAGNLVFLMDGTTAAGTTRHYRLAFDLVGDCPTCPAPPPVPVPVTVDSLTYQNQDT